MKKIFNKGLVIGLCCGAACGLSGGCGYIAGRNAERRRARDEQKRECRRAYRAGIEQATREAQQWIDENILIVNGDDPEAVQKAVEDRLKTQEAQAISDTQEGAERENEPFTGVTGAIDGDNIEFTINAKGDTVSYPKMLFFDRNGVSLDEMQVRANLQNYEKNPLKLQIIWHALGFGHYMPEPDIDMNNLDLDIDDELLGDEPEEKTIERERYLDEVDRYRAHPEEGPRIISRQEFDDECYLDKTYIDYYDADNTFIENTDVDNPVDAFTLLGVVNGNDLFARKPKDGEDDDPDIVYVKNFRQNCVMEVTRFHRAYQSIRDGGAYISGGADQSGGTEGM